MLCAGLAGEDTAIDEARGEDLAAAIDDFHAVGQTVAEELRSEIGDHAVFDEQIALLVIPAGGVDQPPVDEVGAAPERPPVRGNSFGRSRESASRTALRTATPIATCSRMRLRAMSPAPALSIATPRFVGPGGTTRRSDSACASSHKA